MNSAIAASTSCESGLDVKAATLTVASSLIGNYGVDLIAGGARLVGV